MDCIDCDRMDTEFCSAGFRRMGYGVHCPSYDAGDILRVHGEGLLTDMECSLWLLALGAGVEC